MSTGGTAASSPPLPAVTAGRDIHISGGNVIHAPYGNVQLHLNEGRDHVDALNKLGHHSSPDALHTSRAVFRQDLCSPGTRTVTLANLRSLATSSDPTSPDVIWMHGPAGAGKSAIMRTLATELASENIPIATFFFFRSESQRNTSAPFIPTLASQIWDVIPAIQPHISRAIRQNQSLFSRPAHLQMPQLLEEPLVNALESPDEQSCWTSSTPLAMIIDGLDECTDLDGQAEIVRAMVQLAASIRSRTDRRIKIFIASRPEGRIKPEFDALMKEDQHIVVISLDSSDANIHLFYDERFERMRKEHNLPSTWPSEEEIEWLTDKTSGQYALAGLSTRYMAGGDPVLRLKIIRQAIKEHTVEPFDALDKLYATIFEQLPQEMRRPAVLILRFRLRKGWHNREISVLEPIFQLSRGYIQSLVPYLSSLINFEDNLESYHASLADFLTDSSRSEKFALYVDDPTLSRTIQRGLLSVVAPDSQPRRLTGNEMYCLSQFVIEQGTNQVQQPTPSPLPVDELDSFLKNVEPAQLNLWSWHFACQLLVMFKAQSSLSTYARSPGLWYTMTISLPRRLELVWESRMASYGELVDLVCGLALLSSHAIDGQIEFEKPQHLLLKVIESHQLAEVDATRGWNFSAPITEDSPNFWASRVCGGDAAWMEDYAPSVWRWVQAVLCSVAQSQWTDNIKPNTIRFDSKDYSCALPTLHTNSPQSEACPECFSKVQEDFFRAVVNVLQAACIPPEGFVVLCDFGRNHADCWNDLSTLQKLREIGRGTIGRLSDIPPFLSSQKRKVERGFWELGLRLDAPHEGDVYWGGK